MVVYQILLQLALNMTFYYSGGWFSNAQASPLPCSSPSCLPLGRFQLSNAQHHLCDIHASHMRHDRVASPGDTSIITGPYPES